RGGERSIALRNGREFPRADFPFHQLHFAQAVRGPAAKVHEFARGHGGIDTGVGEGRIEVDGNVDLGRYRGALRIGNAEYGPENPRIRIAETGAQGSGCSLQIPLRVSGPVPVEIPCEGPQVGSVSGYGGGKGYGIPYGEADVGKDGKGFDL